MSYLSALNLRNAVTISRTTESPDGMGGFSSTTASVIISRAALWQVGSNDRYVSDRVAAVSTHLLACRVSDDVLFTDKIVYNGKTYDVSGEPDDVQQRGKMKIVPLQLVE